MVTLCRDHSILGVALQEETEEGTQMVDALELMTYVHQLNVYPASEEAKHLNGAWQLFKCLKVYYLEARFKYK